MTRDMTNLARREYLAGRSRSSTMSRSREFSLFANLNRSE